jgi:hypothetical protein
MSPDGRVRRLRAAVERPADVWLFCRMGVWAIALPLLKRILRLETLARIMWSGREARGAPQTDKVIALSRLLTRRPPRGAERCYERSLLAYRFLSQRGVDPRLVTAVRKADGSFVGHAWVTVAGTAVGESDAIEEFVPLVVFGRGGLPEDR